MAHKALANFSPGRTILISILLMIVVGTLLLALPAARLMPISWIDLLFTATSATCVTGLLSIPLEQFTSLGQFIILALIQIGGLGIITMSFFFISLFVDLGLTTQLMAGQLLELSSWKTVKKIVALTIAITLIAESIGALCIYAVLHAASIKNIAAFESGAGKSIIFESIFHAISSFCNAGVSPVAFSAMHNSYMLILTTLLMLIGSLGFITWYEVFCYCIQTIQKKRYRFSLHSTIVLYGSGLIIIISMIIFYLLERNNMLKESDFVNTFLYSLFYAVSFRGSGFLLASADFLRNPTKFFALIIAFVGASPLSTGSGIKITTFVIFLFFIKTVLLGKTSVNIRGRRIVIDQIYKVIAIIALSLMWITVTIFFLLITDGAIDFFDLFFEAFSAFTNLGLATGISAQLSIIGKCLIIMSMIIGRIGSVAFILALRTKSGSSVREFSYPEERVMLG